MTRDPAPTRATIAATGPQRPAPARAGTTVVLRAARGDSWVEARAGDLGTGVVNVLLR